MSEFPNRYKHTSNPTADLLAAIEKLKCFAEQNEISSPKDFTLQQKALSPDNPLEQTIALMRNFFLSNFSEKVRIQKKKNDKKMRDEVLQAIDVLKSHYFLIQTLQEGTPDQQKIAASALSIVERYNQVVLQSRKNVPNWSHRIGQFLYGPTEELLTQPLIELPQLITHNFPKKISHKLNNSFSQTASIKISSIAKQHEIVTASTQEIDGFIMKGIKNFQENEKSAFSSLVDLIKSIRGAPIEVIIKQPTAELGSPIKTVSMRQILTPFPGETFELTGEFKRQSQCSFPVPHSFHLFSKSIQTGFPHPSQHTGWALANSLIPACPKKMEQLLLLQPLLHQKKAIGDALLPNGEYRQKAKLLLKLKKHIFEASKEELLNLHMKLQETILHAYYGTIPDKQYLVIEQFFNGLKERPLAYDELSETQHILLETFIRRPFEKLTAAWTEHTLPGFFSIDAETRYCTALTILQNEKIQGEEEILLHRQTLKTDYERNAIDYILTLGEILFSASSNIILQYFSEFIHFPPPVLRTFDQKVQFCAYRQLTDFLEDVKREEILNTPSSIKEQFRRGIEQDIAVFVASSCDEIDDPLKLILTELEAYYNSQYIFGVR